MDITIAGSVVVPVFDPDEYGRINIELAAFDGEVGIGQFPVPDPSGTGFVASGRQLKVAQGSAVLSDGFIIDQDWQRGPFRTVSEREYNYSVQDANALLGGGRVIRTRPSETDYTRVAAFATLDGPTWDTTWVLNSSTVTMPGKKYDGDQGWAELITDVVEFTGKTLFLHDKAAGGRCLHYHLLTTGHTCGLVITDVLSALDATHFAPKNALRQSTEIDLRNDVEGRDQAGRTVTLRDTTSIASHDADGLQHKALVDFTASSRADLVAKTAAFLASNKDEYHTYTCAIGPLDATALALIRVGDIITVTSKAMGLTASNQRIAHIALSPWNNAPELWLARLELGAPVRRRARVRPTVRGTVGPATIAQNFDVVTESYTGTGARYDDFTRTVAANSWGGVWTVVYPNPNPADIYVDGNHGIISMTSGIVQGNNIYVAGFGPWAIGEDFTLTMRFTPTFTAPSGTPPGFTLYTGTPLAFPGAVSNVGVDLSPQVGGALHVSVFGTLTYDQTTIAAASGKTFLLKWEHTPSQTSSSLKVWEDGSDEPSGWMVSRSTSGDDYTDMIDAFVIEAACEAASSFVQSVDYIDFNARTPVSFQVVVNDVPPEVPDGIRTQFSVYGGGPIREASLKVWVNGIDWTREIVIIDLDNGTYTFWHPPKAGDEIVAQWMYP